MLSRPENITPIIEAITRLRPTSIADVGAATGKFGLLIREALAAVRAEAGDLNPDPWQDTYLEAWEGSDYFLGWYGDILAQVFDRVIRTNATPDVHPRYLELVLLVDVLEHLPQTGGAELLEALVRDNGAVLLSTPREVHFYEPTFYGIAKHVHQWTPADLPDIAGVVEDLSTPISHILLIREHLSPR